MQVSGSRKMYFWIGLAVLLILYCLYYFCFIYGLAYEIPSLRARHFVKFIFILACYAVGVVTLRRLATGWMLRLWHLIYLICLILLLLLGIYDWSIARTPLQVRIVADDLQEFLVSPLLYVAMGLFSSYLKGL
jgi:hypothetical protein